MHEESHSFIHTFDVPIIDFMVSNKLFIAESSHDLPSAHVLIWSTYILGLKIEDMLFLEAWCHYQVIPLDDCPSGIWKLETQ